MLGPHLKGAPLSEKQPPCIAPPHAQHLVPPLSAILCCGCLS